VGDSGAASKAGAECYSRSVIDLGTPGRDAVEKARVLLAECILAVTSHAETDVNKIISLAMTMFRIEERRLRQP